jgi:A/G-specific adenine glycosylase
VRCYAPAVSPTRATRDLRHIRITLLAWYDREHRAFPWRGLTDPYAVLVSEVMLQQTQASRIAERFPRFLARFPTAAVLAAAPAAELLAEWSGLGYNRRALALQRAAAAVVRDGWPETVEGLERLPGIGPYTARAVASLAFGAPVGVVDTNVRRWLIRRLAVTDAPADLQRAADALATAAPDGRATDWTHATMEFGASVCRSRDPRCDVCPIADGCASRGIAVRVPVTRQAPLRGSDRAYRGAVVRLLAERDGGGLVEAALRRRVEADRGIGPALDDGRWTRLVDALERDGLIHRAGGVVRLGAATIGA